MPRRELSDNNLGARVATESISFRLEEEMLDRLRELAIEKKISLNSLVSQVLDHYVTLGVYDKTFGFFAISQDVLRLLLAKQTDEEIDKIVAVAGAKIHRQLSCTSTGR